MTSKARFSGEPLTSWLDNGRDMKLEQDFSFTDKDGVIWQAHKNDIPNGSSIPRVFWSAVGSPYVGKHRNASIVHDKYCKLREKSGKSHKQVHQMYYQACLVGGVGRFKAKLMYLGIKVGGPKW